MTNHSLHAFICEHNLDVLLTDRILTYSHFLRFYIVTSGNEE